MARTKYKKRKHSKKRKRKSIKAGLKKRIDHEGFKLLDSPELLKDYEDDVYLFAFILLLLQISIDLSIEFYTLAT